VELVLYRYYLIIIRPIIKFIRKWDVTYIERMASFTELMIELHKEKVGHYSHGHRRGQLAKNDIAIDKSLGFTTVREIAEEIKIYWVNRKNGFLPSYRFVIFSLTAEGSVRERWLSRINFIDVFISEISEMP